MRCRVCRCRLVPFLLSFVWFGVWCWCFCIWFGRFFACVAFVSWGFCCWLFAHFYYFSLLQCMHFTGTFATADPQDYIHYFTYKLV